MGLKTNKQVPMPKKQPSYNEMFYEIRDALCSNGLTASVADFLADLAVRVKKLEDKNR
jgi:hypothetical protein